MPQFDVISIGGAVSDHTLYVSEARFFSTPQNLTAQKMIAFEYGSKIYAKSARITIGGGAANSSVSLARLGVKVATICRLGKDSASTDILNTFKKEGINEKFIQLDQDHLTSFSFILNTDKKDSDRTIFNYIGCGDFLTVDSKKLKNLKAKWLYLTSLSGKSSANNLKEIFKLTEKNNIKVYWNPGMKQIQMGKKSLAGYLKQTEILTLNKDEAIELVLSGIKLGRRNPKHLNKPVYLLNILQEWGPKIVMVTDGRKGAWVYDGKKIYNQKIKNSKVVDRTGVGDCYGSSFLAGYMKEKGDIKKALKYAAINSASVVTKVGAQNGLLTLKKLKEKL